MVNTFFNFFLENNLKKNVKYFSCFSFGILFVSCFPPFNFFPFLFFIFPFLFLKSYNAESKKDAFLIGWFFGLAFFILSLHWIFNSFLIRSGIFIYILPFCLIFFSLFLAFFTGFVTFLNYKFKTSINFNIIFFSIFWTLSEILRGYLFTGFPWNLLAHTISDHNVFLQICSIFGVYGLSFFLIYFVLSISIFFFFLKKKGNFFLFISSFLIFFSIFLYGSNRLKNLSQETYTSNIFRLVQPNISQEDKLKFSKLKNNYEKLIDLSFKNKRGALNISENLIIFWPETAISNIDDIFSYSVFNKIKSNLKDSEYLFSGTFRKKENNFFNSIVAIDNKLTVNFVYDKIHLVPFGEYTPFTKFFNNLGFNFTSLQSGPNNQEIINYKNLPSFKPLICYEIIFPGKFIKKTDDAKIIVNLTNDAWFGNTLGPHQHLVNSKFRAIEEGKQLIRVANTGISASIDPFGRIIKKLSLNSEGYIDTKIFVGKKNNEFIETFYSKYKNNLIFSLLLILFFILCILKYSLKIERKN